ncbi:hypothetical protein ES703_45396 [subsurface metagenome]
MWQIKKLLDYYCKLRNEEIRRAIDDIDKEYMYESTIILNQLKKKLIPEGVKGEQKKEADKQGIL